MFDFEKNLVVDSLDGVPSQFQGLYEAGSGDNEGKFVVSAVATGIVEAYIGTNKSLTSARVDKKTSSDESASRRKSIKTYEDYFDSLGLEEKTVESLKDHVDSLVAAVDGGKEMQVNLDKIQRDADRRVDEVTTNYDTKLAAKDLALEKHLIGDVATREIAAAKGAAELLNPIVSASCKVMQDGDNYVVRVVDNQGDIRSDGKGGWMTVTDLVGELKNSDAYARAFDSEEKGGGGMPPGSGNYRPARQSGEGRSSVEKISSGLKGGAFQRGAA